MSLLKTAPLQRDRFSFFAFCFKQPSKNRHVLCWIHKGLMICLGGFDFACDHQNLFSQILLQHANFCSLVFARTYFLMFGQVIFYGLTHGFQIGNHQDFCSAQASKCGRFFVNSEFTFGGLVNLTVCFLFFSCFYGESLQV